MRIWTEKRRNSEANQELIWASVVTLILLAALLLPLLPDRPSLCMFHRLTGKPCLSCGMTRAFECALRGRFSDAFLWNPLGLLFFFAAILYAPYAWTVVLFRLPPLRISLTAKWERISLLVLLLAVVLLNWIYIWHSPMSY